MIYVVFGKKDVKKEVITKVNGGLPKTGFSDRVNRFSKNLKSSSYNNFGLSNDERLQLFIKNKIINSRSNYNGWYITIEAVNFAVNELDYNISINKVSDLVITMHDGLKKK